MRQRLNIPVSLKFLSICFGLFLLINFDSKAQILFAEDCFVGGVTTAGANSINSVFGSTCEIKWEENYTLRSAYAITYRYGRPDDFTMNINDTPVTWYPGNQIGPEQIETTSESDFFACHIENITSTLNITGNIITTDLPPQPYYEDGGANWGYWSVHIVILYESPDIVDPICVRLYTADQNQVIGQNYQFEKPNLLGDTPVLLSIYADRLSEFESDRSSVMMNGQIIGDIWTDDLFFQADHGVQGTFYYENSECQGMNGDTANTTMHRHDAIAIINDFFNEDNLQNLFLYRVESIPDGGFNPHPAFTLTYTPECSVTNVEIQRAYTYCRGGNMQINAEAGYEHYEWTPAEGLSDPNVPNPICSRDSSGWYQVRMYNDDGCSQTIPVHVEVTDYPRPTDIFVGASVCPLNTGAIIMEETPGAQPIAYQVNELENNTGSFDELAPGNYNIINTTAHGCTWDTTVTIDLNPLHEAAFTANPETGYSPLSVFFDNESTQISTSYQWLIDGQPISTSENFSQQFPDSGTFEVQLIAYYQAESCADTAAFTLIVYPGLKLVVPNIISPNGDGRNDALVAKVEGVSSASWQVYNRWGRVLHTGSITMPETELELWAPNQNEYPTGVYTLVISVRSESGQVKEAVVNVTLKN